MVQAGLAAAHRPAASYRRPGSAAAAATAAAPEAARLQLRDALAGLASPDLQQQSAYAAQALLAASGGTLTEPLLRDALRPSDLATLPGSVRRARYRLAAHALRHHPPTADWGGALLAARDRLVDRCGLEDNAAAAEELAGLAGALAAACIDAYARGRLGALGHPGPKGDLPRDWLSQLLLAPLLRAACRGPARTRVANACLLAHGVLQELRRWGRSGAVLHAAVDCLKQLLKLGGTGALALSAGESLLPLQACCALLGPRLKAAALEGTLGLCERAMQRSEWPVRKAAADTLAALTEAVLAGEGGQPADAAGAGAQQQQQHEQGLSALRALAPAMVAALEQHLKYDRIPQVRQAAAAALALLHPLLPGAQPQQRRASVGRAATAPAAAAAAAKGGQLSSAGRADLQAIIAERRRQLQESGWQQAGGSEALEGPVIGGPKAAAAAMAACRASSTGSADGVADGGAGGGHIRAWAPASQHDQHEAAAPAAAAQQRTGNAAAPGADEAQAQRPTRPPSADVFQTAAEAMQWLDDEAAPPQARKRRGWGTQPAPTASQPEQLQQQAQQQAQQVWRENPLAQSAEAAQGGVGPASAPAPAAVVACAHHVQHSQFSLRLHSAPAEAELRLAGGGQQPPPVLHGVRVWAGQGGSDVGLEFELSAAPMGPHSSSATVLHRYWLQDGRLHKQQTAAGAGAASASHAASAAAAEPYMPVPQAAPSPAAAPPRSPSKEHTPGRSLAVPQPPPHSVAAESAGLPAESPLASLATAVLPSFSPDRPASAGTARPSPGPFSTPGCAAQASGTVQPQSPAGTRSTSPENQRRASTVHWATSLRPPGEQLLPGLPDWDRSRPGSPVSGCGGITGGSRAASPGGSRAGSRPGSRPGSPSRMSLQHAAGSGGSSRAASPAPVPAGPEAESQPFHQQRDGEQQAAPARPAAGPLTAMVNRAVSRLQQLHELEEELGLPAGAVAPGGSPPGAAGAPQQQERGRLRQQADLRRSLEPVLSAIAESSLGSLADGRSASCGASASPRSGVRSGACAATAGGSPGGSTALRRSQAQEQGSEGAYQREMGRLQRLQEQLQLNMQEIQQRMEEAEARSPQAHASASPAAGAGSSAQAGQWPNGHRYEQPLQERYSQQASEDAELEGPAHTGTQRQRRQQGGALSSGSPASSSGSEPASPASSSGRRRSGRAGSQVGSQAGSQGQVVMAVSNPLFGSSRPTTAQGQRAEGDGDGVRAAQPMHGMLPPKRSLIRRRSSSPSGGSAQPAASASEGQQQRQQGAQQQARPWDPRASSSSLASAAAAAVQERRQRQQQPLQMSGALLQSLGSLGSEWEALARESEAEVDQFLRGSLAASPALPQHQLQHQQHQQLQHQQQAVGAEEAADKPSGANGRGSPASQRTASLHLPVSEPRRQSFQGGGGARRGSAGAKALLGSLDLGAILGSLPASPARLPRFDSSSSDDDEAGAAALQTARSGGDGGWQTARSGGNSGANGWQTARSGGDEGWHTARSGRGSGTSRWQERAAGQGWLSTSDESSGWVGEASELQRSGQLSADGTQSREQELACADLQLLRISSRPSSPSQRPQRPGSPGARSRGSTGQASASLSDVVSQTFPAEALQRLEQLRAQLSPSHSPDVSNGPQCSGSASGGSGQRAASVVAQGAAVPTASAGSRGSGGSGGRQAAPAPSELLPRRSGSPELAGLRISRRQAQLLQSAVGRMPGNPGESADAACIQEALMDVLAGWTAHVQAHYKQAAAERQAQLRRRHGADAAALARDEAALQAAQEAGVRGELGTFVEQVLPRLAEVLSSREQLLRCFEAAAAAEEVEGGE